MKPTFGTAIQSYRKEAGLTQKYVAYSSGIRPQRYSGIESGLPPTEDEVERIADTLDTDISEIAARWSRLLSHSQTAHHTSW